MKVKTAFIRMGIMGAPMAINLLKAVSFILIFAL
jgi:3-hydroxyisobutyrate dehydrogenase-like beta-hydroxyacid dehydrogenase